MDAPQSAGPAAPGRVAPPVLVLGSHRSGTSAVTGMLSIAGGLELGDVLPATDANPKGYFESVAVVRAHNRLLAGLDRDWTCPPSSFEPPTAALAPLRDEIARLDATGRPWGVKDPRLLFTLPLWAELLPEVRLVGVLRDHEECVRSLVARDGLEPGVADTITAAHIRRLRVLADRFDIPVIDFSSEEHGVLDRTGEVASALGLAWDEDRASSFYEEGLAGRRARQRTISEDVELLRAHATTRTSVEVVTAGALTQVLVELASWPDTFDRFSGPRSVARRQHVWGALPRESRTPLELVRTTQVAASVDATGGRGHVAAATDLHELHDRLRTTSPPIDGVVMADVLSWLAVRDLGPLLRLVHDNVAPGATVAVGLSPAVHDTRAVRGLAPVDAETVADAAAAAGFVSLGATQVDTTSVVVLVALSTPMSVLRVIAGGATGIDLAAGFRRPEPAPETAAAERASAAAAAERWERRYERLAGRRSVRLALWASQAMQPVFRLVRRLRGGR